MPAGRHPKPLSVLKLEGSYRPNRHGKKSHEAITDEDPPGRPPNLKGLGAEIWDYVVETRSNWIAPSDRLTLEHLCDLWVLRTEALERYQCDPESREARTAFRDWSTMFVQVASRFGLTPSDRARLGEEMTDNNDTVADFVE
tara:strand:+ start:71 stop:496 length:426 start_codon:yes stop_codon:yes gene_type:complete